MVAAVVLAVLHLLHRRPLDPEVVTAPLPPITPHHVTAAAAGRTQGRPSQSHTSKITFVLIQNLIWYVGLSDVVYVAVSMDQRLGCSQFQEEMRH